jgi:hypothetical protein
MKTPEANRDKNRLHQIRLFHLVSQTAGFDKPGGYTELLLEPGAKWSYSDGGPRMSNRISLGPSPCTTARAAS